MIKHIPASVILAIVLFASPAPAQAQVLTTTRPHATGNPTLPPPAPDGQVIELTLPETVFIGIRNNRNIRSAYLDRIAEKFDLRVAEDKFSPRLVLSSGFAYERRDETRGITANVSPLVAWQAPTGAVFAFDWSVAADDIRKGGRGASNVGLTVIQPLLRDAGIDVNAGSIRIARLEEKINRLRLESTLAQTVTQIILAYRDLVRAAEQLRLSRSALQRSKDLLGVNQALVSAGRMAAVEVVQTEADVAAQELAVIEAENQFDSARLGLLSLIAIDARTDIVPKDALDAPRVNIELDHAIALAVAHRTDYLAQYAVIERAGIDLSLAKNRRLWDLSAVGRVSVGGGDDAGFGNPFDTRGSRDTLIGIQLTVPIGDLAPEQAEVRASVGVSNAELRLAEIRQQVELQVRDAVRNVNVRWRQAEIAQRARDLAQRKLEIEKEKLQAGRSSNFQVLAFENDLRVAENRQLTAQILYMNSLTLLDQQLGTTIQTWQIAVND